MSSSSEYLKRKFINEVQAYKDAKTSKEKTEKLVDILDVFYSILDDEKIFLDDLEEIRLKKLHSNSTRI